MILQVILKVGEAEAANPIRKTPQATNVVRGREVMLDDCSRSRHIEDNGQPTLRDASAKKANGAGEPRRLMEGGNDVVRGISEDLGNATAKRLVGQAIPPDRHCTG